MQDYKKRQLTRVGCTRAQRSWFPLRRSLSMCQRDSRHPRPPLLEQIHALYGRTGHVYNAASKEQTQERWDHCRTSVQPVCFKVHHLQWQGMMLIHRHYDNSKFFVSLKTLVKHLNDQLSISSTFISIHGDYVIGSGTFFWCRNLLWRSLSYDSCQLFNSNKLYGAKSQATALFPSNCTWVKPYDAMLRFNQFHPMITRQSIYYGWSSMKIKQSCKRTGPVHI